LNPNQYNLVKEYHLQVFNRWGEKLFETNDVTQQWQPEKSQQGVYVFNAEVRDIYNVLQVITGAVEILK
jgi:hypothetical protein